jgi:O-antigen/teichoic acid export membrane protein
LTTLLLGALLSPSDFGVLAAALAVISLAQIVVEMGMGAAIIQRRSEVNEAASVALAYSLILGVVLYITLWIVSPWLATVLKIAGLEYVLRVVGIALVLSALISVPNALLTRALEFRKLLWIGALPQVANALVAVGLALAGARFWALIAGYLAGRITNLVLVWSMCRWRPRPVFRRDLFRSLAVFGLWMFASGIQSWLFLSADNLLAGRFFGAHSLGVYSLGFNLANLPGGLLIASLAAVAYPAFSALQSDHREVGRSLLRLQGLAAAILFPACFGLAALGGPAATLLYGGKWSGLGWTLGLMAVMPGLSHLWSLNADAFRAIGRPDVWTKLAGGALVILFSLLILSAHLGYRAFVVARFVGALSLPIFNVLATRRVFQASLRQQFRSIAAPALCAVVGFAVVLCLRILLAPLQGAVGWLKLLSLAGLGAAVYAVGLYLTDRDLFCRSLSSLGHLGLNRRMWSPPESGR